MWHIMIFRVTGFCAQPYEVVSLPITRKGHSFGWDWLRSGSQMSMQLACCRQTQRHSQGGNKAELVVTTACRITGDSQGVVKSFNPNRGERVVVMTTAGKRAHVLGRGVSIITAEAPGRVNGRLSPRRRRHRRTASPGAQRKYDVHENDSACEGDMTSWIFLETIGSRRYTYRKRLSDSRRFCAVCSLLRHFALS